MNMGAILRSRGKCRRVGTVGGRFDNKCVQICPNRIGPIEAGLNHLFRWNEVFMDSQTGLAME